MTLADVAAPIRREPFRALRHPSFRLLWVIYAVGDLGFWLSYISLQWQMTRETGSDASWLGLLFFMNFIPMLLLAPVAGVVADRVDRKQVLIVGRSVCTAIAGVLTALAAADALGPIALLVLAASLGSVFALTAPAGQAVVANAVPPADLASAVSLQTAGANITRIAGPAVAAPILGLWGSDITFALYALSNVVMVTALLRLPIAAGTAAVAHAGMWRQFRAGLAHARDRRPALAALVTMGCFSVFGGASASMYPVFATEVFDRDETAFTVLVMASAVGAIAGALSTGLRRGVPTLRSAALWFAGFAITLVAFAQAPSWPLALVAICSNGVFYFATTTTLNTLLHHLADDDKRGRMMGLFTVTWAGLLPFGGPWMGASSNAVGAPATITIGAGVCFVVAATVLVRSSSPDRTGDRHARS